MGLYVGQDGKLYYNSATNASPTWVLIDIVGDVGLPDQGTNVASVDLRLTSWVLGLHGKLKGAIEFMLAHSSSNTLYTTLRGVFTGRTTKQFAVANGAIATAGTEYFKAFCGIESFPLTQPTQEMAALNVRLFLAYVEESSTLVEPSYATAT